MLQQKETYVKQALTVIERDNLLEKIVEHTHKHLRHFRYCKYPDIISSCRINMFSKDLQEKERYKKERYEYEYEHSKQMLLSMLPADAKINRLLSINKNDVLENLLNRVFQRFKDKILPLEEKIFQQLRKTDLINKIKFKPIHRKTCGIDVNFKPSSFRENMGKAIKGTTRTLFISQLEKSTIEQMDHYPIVIQKTLLYSTYCRFKEEKAVRDDVIYE